MSVSLAIISGCADETDNTQEESAEQIIFQSGENYPSITFNREIEYTDSLLLDRIHDVVVDDSGSVYMAGEKWNHLEVHQFSAEGSYIGSFGRLGESSGQFQSIDRVNRSGDDLWVSDRELNRVTRFDKSTGDVIEIFEMDSLFAKSGASVLDSESSATTEVDPVGPAGADRILVTISDQRNPAYQPEFQHQYAFLDMSDSDAVTLDSLFTGSAQRYVVGDYAGRPVAFSLEINERPLVDFGQDGLIYEANSSDFVISVYNETGELVKTYRYPYERLKLIPEEDVYPAYTYNRQLFMIRESAEYPENWPALYHLFLDDEQRIWVSTVAKDRLISRWYIIDDANKEISASFVWPIDKPIWDVENGKAYTVESDSAGFKTVVRYAIETSD